MLFARPARRGAGVSAVPTEIDTPLSSDMGAFGVLLLYG